jgi:hypothetical protein
LPNQLRLILQSTNNNKKEVETGLTDISKTLFWHGYNVWCARKRLVKQFWKKIAPVEWNKYKKKNLRVERRKKAIHCCDPFHFLQKCNNLSKEKSTPCSCSEFHLPIKKIPERNILDFITLFPKIQSQSQKEIEHNILRKSVKYVVKNKFIETQEDKIRDQHDRGKRRKKD